MAVLFLAETSLLAMVRRMRLNFSLRSTLENALMIGLAGMGFCSVAASVGTGVGLELAFKASAFVIRPSTPVP